MSVQYQVVLLLLLYRSRLGSANLVPLFGLLHSKCRLLLKHLLSFPCSIRIEKLIMSSSLKHTYRINDVLRKIMLLLMFYASEAAGELKSRNFTTLHKAGIT
uniref:Secreted protein n=1 Tax=Anopheles minimus TaxID=112268 RepID=A0A182WN30_9DIPT